MEKTFTAGRSMPVELHGMVVSSQPIATQTGLEILKRGGSDPRKDGCALGY